MSTFITFGNLRRPFISMINALCDSFGFLPTPIRIQAGHSLDLLLDKTSTLKLYEFEVFEICAPHEFLKYTESSELVICHAGLGAISTCISVNKYPAVFARSSLRDEHINNHQVEFVNYYKNQGIFYACESSSDLNDFIDSRDYKNLPARTELYPDSSIAEDIVQYLKL